MKIRQMNLVNYTETVDTDNDLAFVIYTPSFFTRWSIIQMSVQNRICDSYYRAFDFKDIYVTKNTQQNILD